MAKPVILVAGGAGYIGAPFCKAAEAEGFTPVVIDRLASSSPRVEAFRRASVKWGPLEISDIGDQHAVLAIIEKYKPVAAVCFAALIDVAESVAKPELYWENNFLKAAHFFQALELGGVNKLVFSSTAAVYGIPLADKPLLENDRLDPINPYGATKLGCEAMLQGSGVERAEIQKQANGKLPSFADLKSVVFRYFNAAGADNSSGLGEMHDPETHLIPNALLAAGGHKKFMLNGTDFPTRDGTAIRDFVHVDDLAAAHITGLHYLLDGGKNDAFNLGTGHGASVREVITAVRSVTGKDFTVTEGPRREGDPPFLVAGAAKAASVLGWKPKQDLSSIIASAHEFHSRQG